MHFDDFFPESQKSRQNGWFVYNLLCFPYNLTIFSPIQKMRQFCWFFIHYVSRAELLKKSYSFQYGHRTCSFSILWDIYYRKLWASTIKERKPKSPENIQMDSVVIAAALMSYAIFNLTFQSRSAAARTHRRASTHRFSRSRSSISRWPAQVTHRSTDIRRTLFEIFIFVQKFNFDFPRKLSIFLGEKLVKMLWFWTF